MLKSKTIKTQRSNSLYTIDNLFHKYDSYCCPFCTKLPEILSYNEGNGNIKFKCKNHGENSIDIQEYLENMKKYVSTSELNTKNKCSKHKNDYVYYCLTCQENLCSNCLKEFEKDHENHIQYKIDNLRPNNNEIFLIKNKISIYLQQKSEYMEKIKNLDIKISFYDALINSLEKQRPNYFLNINIKHLLYGETINLDNIIKDSRQKSGLLEVESKKEKFDDFVKNNFIKATEGMNQLMFVNTNLGDENINKIFSGIENTDIFKILKFGKKITNPKEVIKIKDIKCLNLRGNKLTNINFLLGKDCSSLEILGLNDNEITSIDNLKNINCPLLKELYLSKNKISSIDILSELKIKKLQILWLSENNISSIDVLEKVDFPQLRKLGLNKNKIKNINVFQKKKFPQLFELYLNENEIDTDNYSDLIENISFKIKEFYY